jgi:stearoyl-CoA desaturase (delta-9 desaturase)
MPQTKPSLDLVNVLFLSVTHALAPVAILYMIFGQFSWWTLGLGLVYFAFSGLAITGGYHRLFSHPTYQARGFLRFFYLFFGAASVQNSALKWSSDHRVHHAKVDTNADPYNIKEGFWWAHVGWIFFKDDSVIDKVGDNVGDLEKDKLVMLQHNHYILFIALSLLVLPFALGMIWGDPVGAVLVAGFLRLTIQWHATFSVNSIAHMLGSQPYSTKSSARDSVITAFITLGEGYHNYHHAFAGDYRNGIRWFHFDPTKWFVWSCSKVNITWDLKRASTEAIERAKAAVRAERGLPTV